MRTTRRRFLAQASALVGAPLILSRSASARSAANERTTVALIGAGKRGHSLLRNFLARSEVQLVAVAEVEGIRRDHAKAQIEKHYAKETKNGKFEGCKTYLDFREVLARDDIDALIIATPDHWHAIPVVLAAKAQKDMYCEKPLSLTIREAQVMVQQVKKSGVIFQTGSQQRSEFGGRFHKACELVRNGRIGKVHEVTVGVGGDAKPCDLPGQPKPDNVDWNMWLGPAPYREYNEILCPKGMHKHFPAWRHYQEYSGGGFTDIGAHHFDIAQWGLGMDGSGPVKIIPPEEKNQKLTFKYANGVTMYHGGPSGITFKGDKGTVYVDRHKGSVDPKGIDSPLPLSATRLYKSSNHVANFVECVRDRKETICPAEVGAGSAVVCHLGNLAMRNKRQLEWDPKAWKFVGDAEANSWLDRKKRGEWQKVWDKFDL